jgi:hypothetical protein
MRIAILETEHFEVAYPLIRLFDTPAHQLTIFTSKNCLKQFEQLFPDSRNRFQFITRAEESKLAFIYNAYKHIRQQQADMLILSTVTDNFLFYYLLCRQLKGVRIILTLHDVNTFFQHKFSSSLRRLVRITGKKLLVKQVQEFNVIAMPLVIAVKKHIPPFKKVHCLPGAVFEPGRFPVHGVNKTGLLNVVVPGSIDKKRRDYEVVFTMIEALKSESTLVQIILLGAAHGNYGQEILKRAEAFAEAGYQISFYKTSVIDQVDYDKALNEADLVFIPSVIQTVISDDITETYGSTKSSGTLFDVVRHAKPFIIPKALAIDAFLEQSAFRYEKPEDITGFIKACISNPAYLQELHQKALAASANYTIEEVRSRNPDLFPLRST